MTCLPKKSRLLLLALAISGSFSSAQTTNPTQTHGCDDSILEGNYALTITGQILGGASPIPVAGVAMTHFDGKGSLRQVDHVLHGGQQPAVNWRVGTGTYKIERVSEDIDTDDSYCVGTATITPLAGEGPPLNLYLVVAKDGSEVRIVVNDMGPKGPPVAITSIGVRVHPRHYE